MGNKWDCDLVGDRGDYIGEFPGKNQSLLWRNEAGFHTL